MYRDNTKVVKIGNVAIGGGNKIAIQSMTNTKTEDVKATVEQILALEKQAVTSSEALFRRWKRQKRLRR